MMNIDLFNKFCNYVDNIFFSEENIGSYIAFVVDQSFINEFCSYNHISEKELMSSVKRNINKRDILSIKGIIAIQLYAASKRVSIDDITSKNYRYQLSQILDWDMNDLQTWMSNNQEELWEKLYRWCDEYYYKITKCDRKEGAWRYAQYPVKHAQCVFTEEDLRYIAAYFVEKNLQKDEDIQENEFWKIIHPNKIKLYVETNHGKEVIENSLSDDDYKSQVFNYFLRWDGVYKIKNKQEREKTIRIEKEHVNNLLYLDNDFTRMDIRNKYLSLVKTFFLGEIGAKEFLEYYQFKRPNVILFKKDDVYDDMWIETRYLEKGEDGIIVYLKTTPSNTELDRRRYQNLRYIKENAKVIVYKIDGTSGMCGEYYENKRPYRLDGGLKIGRNIYIKNAGPSLILEEETKVWLNGNILDIEKLKHNFIDLSVGIHCIKIQNYKKIYIEIVDHSLSIQHWDVEYNRWKFDKGQNIWESGRYDDGVIGLDFSNIPQYVDTNTKPILRRWSEAMLNGKFDKKEKNIGIRIIH